MPSGGSSSESLIAFVLVFFSHLSSGTLLLVALSDLQLGVTFNSRGSEHVRDYSVETEGAHPRSGPEHA
jgi:hypothetical protein